MAAGGLYAELYRTQFAVADSPTPAYLDNADPEPTVITVPSLDYVDEP